MFSIISRMSFIAISWGFLCIYQDTIKIQALHLVMVSLVSLYLEEFLYFLVFFHHPDFLRNPS